MQFKTKKIRKKFHVPETISECMHITCEECIYYDNGCKCDIDLKE